MLSKRHWVGLTIIWIISQIVFVLVFGISSVGEGDFVGVADQIVNSTWKFAPNILLYAGHILPVLIVRLVGLPVASLYLSQIAVAGVAFVAFVKLLEQTLSAQSSVIFGSVLFAVCPFYQSWTPYLSSDSIFANLLVIAIYLLVNSKYDSKFRRLLYIMLLIVPFFRPVGFLFIPVAILYWLSNKSPLFKRAICFFGVYFCILALAILIILNYPNNYYYAGHNSEANIICGYPGNLGPYIVTPYSQEKGILRFFFENPQMTWRLMLSRLVKSFWMTRPYFSTRHNLFIAIGLVPYYILAGIGFVHLLISRTIKRDQYLLPGVLLFLVPSVIFCADWANRFILPEFVFVLILVSIGVDRLLTKLKSIEAERTKIS